MVPEASRNRKREDSRMPTRSPTPRKTRPCEEEALLLARSSLKQDCKGWLPAAGIQSDSKGDEGAFEQSETTRKRPHG